MGESTGKTKRPPHRGAANDMATFAAKYLEARLQGFRKDMRICLTGVPSGKRAGLTHAYFPALMASCAMLEYLSAFHAGRINIGRPEVALYAAKFLPQPDYDNETIRILFDAFRNRVNHRGIASGVWCDQNPAGIGRRLTWKVDEGAKRPAVAIKAEAGELKRDSPWPCRYTHRVHIYLEQLSRDIADSIPPYTQAIANERKMEANFRKCLELLYPA